VYHSSTSNYTPNFVDIGKTSVDGQTETDGRTNIDTALSGQPRVDLKILYEHHT